MSLPSSEGRPLRPATLSVVLPSAGHATSPVPISSPDHPKERPPLLGEIRRFHSDDFTGVLETLTAAMHLEEKLTIAKQSADGALLQFIESLRQFRKSSWLIDAQRQYLRNLSEIAKNILKIPPRELR